MNNGWIKIHRKFINWEWYDDTNTKVVFLHCIFRANYEDSRYRGKLIKRGQFLTGRRKFADQLGLSVQQVRTAWEKLESTNEITMETSNKGTLVTVCEYDTYQRNDSKKSDKNNQQDNQKITSKQPADNQQVTTSKNVKNIKNKKNTTSNVGSGEPPNDTVDPKLWEQAIEVAHHLRDRIIEHDPDHKYANNPPSYKRWYVELERALRMDGRTQKQLVFIIDYIFTKNTKIANFWKPNIQSGPKLRDKFDQLKSQIKNEVNNGKPSKEQTVKNAISAVENIDWEH